MNTRPHCKYNTAGAIIDCLESYKSLADVNDKDKLNIRKWVDEHSN